MKAGMQMLGVRQLAVNIRACKAAKERKLKQAINKSALNIRNNSFRGAPRKTGALKNSHVATFVGQQLKFIMGFGEYTTTKRGHRRVVRGSAVRGAGVFRGAGGEIFGPDAMTASVTVGMPYAAAVEQGTSKRPATPYLRPAIDAERGPHEARMREAMRGVS